MACRSSQLIQAWSFAVTGYLVGLGCFLLAREGLSSLRMLLTPQILVGVAIVSFVTCTLASIVAMRRVLTLDPASVFRT